VLLQKGAKFNEHDYAQVKKWLNSVNEKQDSKMSGEIPSHFLGVVELMLYKYELEVKLESLSATVKAFFSMGKTPEDCKVQLKVCNILFNIVVTQKYSPTVLDTLPPIEISALLQNSESPLTKSHRLLFPEIQKLRERETEKPPSGQTMENTLS
jgi:hypothetical protein